MFSRRGNPDLAFSSKFLFCSNFLFVLFLQSFHAKSDTYFETTHICVNFLRIFALHELKNIAIFKKFLSKLF